MKVSDGKEEGKFATETIDGRTLYTIDIIEPGLKKPLKFGFLKEQQVRDANPFATPQPFPTCSHDHPPPLLVAGPELA